MSSFSICPALCSTVRRCCRYLNDHIAGVCRQHPTRFLGLGTLPMQSAELAIPELRRCINELGMVGVQIGSHINDMPLGHEKPFPIFDEGERKQLTKTTAGMERAR